jgi:hypothetical protein
MSISDRPYIHTDFLVQAVPEGAKSGLVPPAQGGTGKSGVLYKEGLIDIEDGTSDKSGIVSL